MKEESRYPYFLKPISKERIWGGDTINKEFGYESGGNIAEAWILSVRGPDNSLVTNGIYSDRTLSCIIKNDPSVVCAGFGSGDPFPVLIKVIDAKDDLSVQVHPDNRFAESHESEPGKTEMWYVISAKEGSEIIYGMKENGTDFFDCPSDEGIRKYLNVITPSEGDTVFIPAGQIHALCKGILVFEVQQNSDLTYRIYDYGRRDKNGICRELHTDKARQVSKYYTNEDIYNIQFSRGKYDLPDGNRLLSNCDYFTLEESITTNERFMDIFVTDDTFTYLFFLSSSEGYITHGDISYPVKKGDSIFIPAGAGAVTVKGDCRFLSVRI